MKSYLKTNILYSGISNFSDMLQFAVMIMAGRILGAEDFGAFSYALSLAIVFITLSNFGLDTMAIRDVSRDHSIATRYFGNILPWRIVLTIVAYSLLLVTVVFFTQVSNSIIIVTAILGIAVSIRLLTLTGRCFLQAFERFDLEAVAVFVEQMVLLVGGVFTLYSGYGLYGLALVFMFARITGFVLVFLLFRYIMRFQLKFERKFIFDLQRKAVPIGVALFVAAAYLNVDTLILTRLLSYKDVGLYNAAFKIYAGLFLFPSIVATVLLPRLSETYLNDSRQNRSLLYGGILLLFVLALPICVFGLLFTKQIMTLVFGAGFVTAGPVMRVLFVVTLITFQVWLLRTYLVSINCQKILMNLSIVGLAVRIVCDIVLIPIYGIMGAAYAACISELVLFGAIWGYLLLCHFQQA